MTLPDSAPLNARAVIFQQAEVGAASTSGLPAAPATGYLLDLGGELLGLPEKFAKGLLEHASQLRDVQSCLVISVTPESWRECAESGSVIAQEIKQPDGFTVAERRLDALSDSPERLKWLGLGFVRAALPPHVGPADAVRLAKKLAEIDPANGSRELERVVEEYRSWPDYINSEFGGEKDPKRRALLIAVAALDGSPAHTIVAARRDFLTALGYQTTPILVLGEPNLEGQLQQIRAHLLEGNVSINSAFPGMDQAILRHFWANYQELHDYLLEWLLRLAVLPGVDDDSRARLSRLIFLITRTNRDFGIVDKMNRLARYPEQRRMIETILEFASVDEDTGQAARELLLRWAKGKSSPNQLAVAKVCRSAFAIAFPQLVATRLRWLLISEDPSVRQEAYKTLRWLAVHSDEAHSPFAVVIDWMQKDESATALAGKRGFAALMIPEGDAAFVRSFLAKVFGGGRGWKDCLEDGVYFSLILVPGRKWPTLYTSGRLQGLRAFSPRRLSSPTWQR